MKPEAWLTFTFPLVSRGIVSANRFFFNYSFRCRHSPPLSADRYASRTAFQPSDYHALFIVMGMLHPRTTASSGSAVSSPRISLCLVSAAASERCGRAACVSVGVCVAHFFAAPANARVRCGQDECLRRALHVDLPLFAPGAAPVSLWPAHSALSCRSANVFVAAVRPVKAAI